MIYSETIESLPRETKQETITVTMTREELITMIELLSESSKAHHFMLEKMRSFAQAFDKQNEKEEIFND